MDVKTILVLTDHMPWGHRSIAKAIFGYLREAESKEKWKVVYADVKAETGLGGELYQWAYKYFPAGNKVALRLLTMSQIRKLTIEYSDVNMPMLEEVVRREKPDLIVSTYFLHSQTLQRMRETNKYSYKLWTVIADPWTPYNLSYVPGIDMHMVYDEVGKQDMLNYGINEKNTMITGWWTRSEMYKEYSVKELEQIRQKLELKKDVPTIFVGGGSLGNSAIMLVLPILLTLFKPVQVVFNTGKDETAQKMVERFKKLVSRIPKLSKTLKVVNLGWIENMSEVLSVCDVVLGKAGPNFIFDVVAAKKPFVAITHIGGQEDGNLDLIRKKKLGIVRENPINLARFLKRFLANPEKFYKKYKASVMLEREYNLAASEKIVGAIKSSLKG